MTNPPGRCANASATDSAEGGGSKVRIRRNLAVRTRSGEGRESSPLQTFGLRPGQPPKGKLDRGDGYEGGQGLGEVLESLARRRFRPNHEKVRSTTQRRGRMTKPFMSSLRLTISMRSTGTLATAASTCRAL